MTYALVVYLGMRSIGPMYVCLFQTELRANNLVMSLSNNLHCQLCSEDCVATIASDEEREMEMQGSVLRSHPSNWSWSTQLSSPGLPSIHTWFSAKQIPSDHQKRYPQRYPLL